MKNNKLPRAQGDAAFPSGKVCLPANIDDASIVELCRLNKAIFLDRDGVINEVVFRNGLPASPRELREFKFLPGVVEVLEKFRNLGFLNIVVTNQPDISRGLFEGAELEKMNKLMENSLAVDEIRNCVHDNNDNCDCRKPKPGMITGAAAKWNIDLAGSFMIGDSRKDMEAGRAAGCRTFLIRTDYNKSLVEGFDFEVNSLEQVRDIIKKIN